MISVLIFDFYLIVVISEKSIKIDCLALRKYVKLTEIFENSPFETPRRLFYVCFIYLMPQSLKLLIPLRAIPKKLSLLVEQSQLQHGLDLKLTERQV